MPTKEANKNSGNNQKTNNDSPPNNKSDNKHNNNKNNNMNGRIPPVAIVVFVVCIISIVVNITGLNMKHSSEANDSVYLTHNQSYHHHHHQAWKKHFENKTNVIDSNKNNPKQKEENYIKLNDKETTMSEKKLTENKEVVVIKNDKNQNNNDKKDDISLIGPMNQTKPSTKTNNTLPVTSVISKNNTTILPPAQKETNNETKIDSIPQTKTEFRSEASNASSLKLTTPQEMKTKEETNNVTKAVPTLTETNNITKQKLSLKEDTNNNNNNAANDTTSAAVTDKSDATLKVFLTKKQQREYNKKFQETTQSDPNLKTMALFTSRFYSGFRNQMMAFTAFVMHVHLEGIEQILLTSIRHKDLYGTNKMTTFEWLFDVVHWNSFYPNLPKMVEYNASQHYQYDYQKRTIHWNNVSNPELNATKPYAYGRYPRLVNRYNQYAKGRGPYAEVQFRNPVELLMMQGALRPHPELYAIIQSAFQSNKTKNGNNNDDDDNNNGEYFALHARIEPDMQVHNVCVELKQLYLKPILDQLQELFPIPPAKKLFLALNRKLLERDALDFKKYNNTIAVENLKVLNHAVKYGLWNGTVQVIEAGGGILQGTTYAKYPGIAGAIVDFFMVKDAKVFIGAEISSFSMDILSNRFYGGHKDTNYRYTPQGIFQWTNGSMKHPPTFVC